MKPFENIVGKEENAGNILTALRMKPFENIVRKGENAGNQHFFLFLQCFPFFTKQIPAFLSHLFLSL